MRIKLIVILISFIAAITGFCWEKYWEINPESRHILVADQIHNQIDYNEKTAEVLLKDPTIVSEKSILNFDPNIADKIHRKGFEMLVFNGDSIVYWSTSQITIDSCLDDLIKGSTFLKTQNGIYQVYKKKSGYYNYLLLFLIKNEFQLNNKYFTNELNPTWKEIENIRISLSPAEGYSDLVEKNGKYCFSFECISTHINYPTPIKWISLLGILILYLLLESLFNYFIVSKNNLWVSLIIGLLIIGLRAFQMYFKYPWFIYEFDLFKPILFATNNLLPSLGDFIINILLIVRLIYLILLNFENLKQQAKLQFIVKYLISILLFLSPFIQVYLIQSLIVNSKISLNFSSKSIDIYTLFALFGITLTFLLSYLSYRLLNYIIKININIKLVMFVLIQALLIVVYLIYPFILIIGIQLCIAYIYILYRKVNISNIQKTLFCLIFSSMGMGLIISNESSTKELENRKVLAQTILERRDSRAEKFMIDIDKKIQNDIIFRRQLVENKVDKNFLQKRIKDYYFSGYLSHYNITIFSSGNDSDRNMVNELDSVFNKNSIPIENTNFSKVNSTTLNQGYIGRYHFDEFDSLCGNLYIVLKLKTVTDDLIHNEVFNQGRNSDFTDISKYSYAVFQNNILYSNQGIYNYNMRLFIDSGQLVNDFFEYQLHGYSHLVYRYNSDLHVVVSKKSESFIQPFSYVFFLIAFLSITLAFLFASNIVYYIIRYLHVLLINRNKYLSIIYFEMRNNMIAGGFNLSLLASRIQLTLAVLLILAIVVTAVISQQSIVSRFNDSLNEKLMVKTKQIVIDIENNTELNPGYYKIEQLNKTIDRLSDLYSLDINMYDLSGHLIATSQPKLFEMGLVSNHMNPNAMSSLVKQNQSQLVQNENIGRLLYLSAYIPIKENNQIVAYLNLPFFSKETELDNEVKLNTANLLTPYSIIFILMSLFSYLISYRISNSLGIIKKRIGEINLGKKNEKLDWKTNDEIGALITQYNQMVDKLEESAEILAKTERDHAWREMAKQIAHEIKNPLTPMKLNLQMLQRAVSENKSDIEERVKKVSNLLIEQIDSLSQLASEFGSFATLTEGIPQEVNVVEICNRMVDLFHIPDVSVVTFQTQVNQAYILINQDAFSRVLNNLIKNAIQATPQGVIPQILIHVMIEDNQVIIKIQDNGTGIPEELKDRIFEPSFSTKNSGMGLGLAIVKKIVERANGEIGFETSSHTGTCFYMKFQLITQS